MRVVMLGLALAVLIARPAGAGRMLYASAASDDRIDGFCLRRDGTIEGTPRVRMDINGTQPRRLIVADGVGSAPDGVHDVLFVVEADRVEAFQIGDNGGLSFIGRTRPRARSGPRDAAISLSTTTQMIYVPDRSRSRILGHALPLPRNSSQEPEPDFKTCIQSRRGAGLQNLVIPDDQPRRLYISSSGGNGRIDVFGIDEDGNLFGANGNDENGDPIPVYTDCATGDAVTTTTVTTTTVTTTSTATSAESTTTTIVPTESTTTTAVFAGSTTTTVVSHGTTTTTATPPLSGRRKIFDVKTFAVSGNLLYAEDRGRKRIRAFELNDDGSFVTPDDADGDTSCEPTKKGGFCKAASKTNRVANYQQILLFRPTEIGTESRTAILGTQFFRGRIDSYALDPVNGFLPKHARISHADLRLTPVRLTAADNLNGKGATVYVAAGEFDRIIAYRLRNDGTLQGKGAKPFSQTDEQDDSFPNDVAIAMLAVGCPD